MGRYNYRYLSTHRRLWFQCDEVVSLWHPVDNLDEDVRSDGGASPHFLTQDLDQQILSVRRELILDGVQSEELLVADEDALGVGGDVEQSQVAHLQTTGNAVDWESEELFSGSLPSRGTGPLSPSARCRCRCWRRMCSGGSPGR